MKFLFSLFLSVQLFNGCNDASALKQLIPDSIQTDSVEAKPDTITSTLLFVGDLMQHGPQIKHALACGNNETYNYDGVFQFVKPMISEATIAIGNLEVTLGGEPYSGYPRFSAPDQYLYAIKDAGFDVLTTVNNHCVDRGKQGLERTLATLEKAGIPCCGTYADSVDRNKRYPLVFDAGGIKVCLLSYTYDTNGLPVTKPNIVNVIDKKMMAADIKKAKSMKPDVIIASMHWGIENVTKEGKEQRELAQWLIDQGVDHVIGGHPHMIQPSTRITDAKGKEHYVVYSLGNYVSNMQLPNNKIGLTVTLKLQKVTDKGKSKTELIDVKEEKTYCSFPALNPSNNYRVIPASTPDSLLSTAERTARVGSLQKDPVSDKVEKKKPVAKSDTVRKKATPANSDTVRRKATTAKTDTIRRRK